MDRELFENNFRENVFAKRDAKRARYASIREKIDREIKEREDDTALGRATANAELRSIRSRGRRGASYYWNRYSNSWQLDRQKEEQFWDEVEFVTKQAEAAFAKSKRLERAARLQKAFRAKQAWKAEYDRRKRLARAAVLKLEWDSRYAAARFRNQRQAFTRLPRKQDRLTRREYAQRKKLANTNYWRTLYKQ